MLISKTTSKGIESFISSPNGGLILLGEKGLGKRSIAESIAKVLLKTETLMTNPDYVSVKSTNQVIKIEDLRELKTCSTLCPIEAPFKVMVIDDANLMTPTAQNSMLKLIEDGNKDNIVIFVAHDKLLSTIHSRCNILRVVKPSEDEFKDFLLTEHKCVNDIVFALSNNIPGNYFALENKKEFIQVVQELFKVLAYKDIKRVLNNLSLMQEKDKDSFFSKYDTAEVLSLLNLIKDVLMELLYRFYDSTHSSGYDTFFDFEEAKKNYSKEGCLKAVPVIQDHMLKMNIKGAYTKNDFFDLFRSII